MMRRDDALLLAEDFLLGRISTPHAFHLVKQYCIDKGKDPAESEEFTTFIASIGRLNWYLSYIIDGLCREHNIIMLSTPEGRIIKVW